MSGVGQRRRSVEWPPLGSTICTRPVSSLTPRTFATLDLEDSDRVEVFVDTIVEDVRDPIPVEVFGEFAWLITTIYEFDPDP